MKRSVEEEKKEDKERNEKKTLYQTLRGRREGEENRQDKKRG